MLQRFCQRVNLCLIYRLSHVCSVGMTNLCNIDIHTRAQTHTHAHIQHNRRSTVTVSKQRMRRSRYENKCEESKDDSQSLAKRLHLFPYAIDETKVCSGICTTAINDHRITISHPDKASFRP